MSASDKLIRCPHGCEQDIPLSLVNTHVLHLCSLRCTGESAGVENYQRLMLAKIDLLLLNQAGSPPVESGVTAKSYDNKSAGDVATLQSKLDDTRKRLEELDMQNERLHSIIYGKSRGQVVGRGEGQVMLEVQSAGYECGNYARVLLGDTFLHINTTRGLNVVVLNRTDYSVMVTGSFDVYESRATSAKFAQFIADQPNLSVMCIVLKDEGSRYLGETAKDTIAALTGKDTIKNLSHRVGYALIAIKGHPDFSIENMSTRGRAAHVRYILPLGGIKELLERGRPEITTNKFSQEVTEITAAYKP